MAFGVVHMGRRGQCAILAGRSQFVCRCCSGSGWLPFPSIMIRRLGCINAILLGGVAFGVVHLWLSWACCHRCKSQSPGAQCCCPVIRLRFVCALVRLTDSIAPDHYTLDNCEAIRLVSGGLERSASEALTIVTSFPPACRAASSSPPPFVLGRLLR